MADFTEQEIDLYHVSLCAIILTHEDNFPLPLKHIDLLLSLYNHIDHKLAARAASKFLLIYPKLKKQSGNTSPIVNTKPLSALLLM